MGFFKCRVCGGQLNISENSKIVECDYCGSIQPILSFDSDKKIGLFDRATDLRLEKEFDKAAGIYESIVAEFPDEPEAYWGLCLCKYGIEYVDDPGTGKKIPTCHRACPISIIDDINFKHACQKADIISKNVYLEEAKAIDCLQKRILEVASKEDPYDVFICYKETDDSTSLRTEDSSLAQDIYTELIKDGYKVFFSRVTLKEKAGEEYEPYIYAALSSAKVMVAVGTKFEYFDAVWVKNEWSRYLAMMEDSSSKGLIPCYKNMDPYEIPVEINNLQALNIADVTFLKNLKSRIAHYVKKTALKMNVNIPGADVEIVNLFKRAEIFLKDENFEKANEYFERILDRSPEEAAAYWGKILCKERCIDNADLYSDKMVEKILVGVLEKNDVLLLDEEDLEQTLIDRWGGDYQNALRFADEKARSEFVSLFSSVLEKLNNTLVEIQNRTREKIREEEDKKREAERIAQEKRRVELEKEKRQRQIQREVEEQAKRAYTWGTLVNLLLVAAFGLLLFSDGSLFEQMVNWADSSFGGYVVTRVFFLGFALLTGIVALIGGCGISWPIAFVTGYPIIWDFLFMVQVDNWSEDPFGTFIVFILWMALSLATAYISSLIFGAISGTQKK